MTMTCRRALPNTITILFSALLIFAACTTSSSHYCCAFVPTTISATSTNVNGKTIASSLGQPPKQYQRHVHTRVQTKSRTKLFMAQISEKEAQAGIDKVVAALRKDKEANVELGRLEKVNNILGYGSPTNGQIAVRFNASFKKGGMGRAAVPLPFGLGQTNQSEGRGVMVGQVKASVDIKSGKVVSCSVFRDLGYGRAFNLRL